ncbi:MAG: glycosyltransferase family 4 protein [Candidatus Bathyarchaeia archaeon]
MNIHIVNTFYPPWRGGAETYTRNLAVNLQMMGHRVSVTAAHPPLKPGDYVQEGVAVRRLRSIGMFYGVPIVPELPRHLMGVEADIIHVNFPNPYTASSGAFMSKLRKMPAVLTWHNDLPPVTKLAGILVKMHDNMFSSHYLNIYDAIITTSNVYFEGSKILKKYWRKVRVVENGVDCERFKPGVEVGDLKMRLGLTKSKVALFVGALTKWHRYKGLEDLLAALKILNREDVKLIVVGDGDLRSEYQNMSERLGLSGRVVFVGNLPDNVLPRYYAASDFLVLPSRDRSEGFGLTILEANASGIPAVASNIGGIPGILTDRVNGLLVQPRDPQALADALQVIVEDDDLRVRMGLMGRKIALSHDWSRVAFETFKVYCEVLQNRSLMKS